jgi:D-inositol-3-phosphate glycosyltransferase
VPYGTALLARTGESGLASQTQQVDKIVTCGRMKQNFQICEDDVDRRSAEGLAGLTASDMSPEIAVALLTGGSDRPYVFGLGTSLMSKVAGLDLIGSDDLDFAEFHGRPGVCFRNLRGSHRPDVSILGKIFRVAAYYAKLIYYAAAAKPKIFHILWNNKFETFDRTLLMLYYRILGKRIVLTVHNVNANKRDSKDGWFNRLTLRIQYRLTHHIFVHTEMMKRELVEEFGVQGTRVTVIPFGINNAVPHTSLTPGNARRQLGIRESQKTLLFFGNITPYKGLEYLIAAFQQLLVRCEDYRLIIAGKPNNCERYWSEIQEAIHQNALREFVLLKADFIPDDETEVYFKAADVLVLPYRYIYQSGVLFLGYSFGLPVLVADVGSLKDEIVEGTTGFVFRPEDPTDLARTIDEYFASDLYTDLNNQRREIRAYATERNSWDVVGNITMGVYASLLRIPPSGKSLDHDVSSTSTRYENPFIDAQR